MEFQENTNQASTSSCKVSPSKAVLTTTSVGAVVALTIMNVLDTWKKYYHFEIGGRITTEGLWHICYESGSENGRNFCRSTRGNKIDHTLRTIRAFSVLAPTMCGIAFLLNLIGLGVPKIKGYIPAFFMLIGGTCALVTASMFKHEYGNDIGESPPDKDGNFVDVSYEISFVVCWIGAAFGVGAALLEGVMTIFNPMHNTPYIRLL